jgi:hypothetical protein
LEAMANAALSGTQVLPYWALSYEPGDDMTLLRSSGRVDTMMLWAQAIEQPEPPKDASKYITTPRGKNVVSRRYGTWLFNETEEALVLKLEAWRVKVNQTPKLGFAQSAAQFIDSVSRLQVPVIDNFPTGDALTPVAYFAQAHLIVRVIEPQG